MKYYKVSSEAAQKMHGHLSPIKIIGSSLLFGIILEFGSRWLFDQEINLMGIGGSLALGLAWSYFSYRQSKRLYDGWADSIFWIENEKLYHKFSNGVTSSIHLCRDSIIIKERNNSLQLSNVLSQVMKIPGEVEEYADLLHEIKTTVNNQNTILN